MRRLESYACCCFVLTCGKVTLASAFPHSLSGPALARLEGLCLFLLSSAPCQACCNKNTVHPCDCATLTVRSVERQRPPIVAGQQLWGTKTVQLPACFVDEAAIAAAAASSAFICEHKQPRAMEYAGDANFAITPVRDGGTEQKRDGICQDRVPRRSEAVRKSVRRSYSASGRQEKGNTSRDGATSMGTGPSRSTSRLSSSFTDISDPKKQQGSKKSGSWETSKAWHV